VSPWVRLCCSSFSAAESMSSHAAFAVARSCWSIVGRPRLFHQLGRPTLIGQTVLERLADVPKLRRDSDLGGTMHSRLAGEAALDGVADRARQAPDSPKIRFAIRSPRRGSGEVGLTISQSRNPRSRVIQPLRHKRRRYHADNDANGDTHFDYLWINCYSKQALWKSGCRLVASGSRARIRRSQCDSGSSA
jgi:hypothetical protein